MKKEQLIKKLYEKNKNKIKRKMPLDNNDKLKIIGVTGSHGKSTVCYLLNEYLKMIGFQTVLYSSIKIDSKNSKYINNTAVEVPLDSDLMLYHALTEAVVSNSDFLILEINDSTIDKKICDDLEFDIKVLTNIEELENQMYEDYVGLKKSFIANGNHKTIIGLVSDLTINIYNELKNSNIISYTTEYFIENKNLEINDVDYYLKPYNNKYHSFNGLEFEIINSSKSYKVKTNLNMPFHGLNITCLYSIINELNVFDKKLFKEFIKDIIIPGRDEIIPYKKGFVMISTGSVPQLEVLNEYKRKNEIKKITLITGTTGYEFPTWDKKYQTEKYLKQRDYDMKFAYEYAVKYVDQIIITSNDPGNNNIEELLKQQESLIKNKIDYKIIKSRASAIQYALDNIQNKEIIFISGRGNKLLMCENNKITKHLDKDVVLDLLKKEV